MPEEMLVDAALLGVPYVGTAKHKAPRTLWPALEARDEDQVVAMARLILTDAALAQRMVDEARAACAAAYGADETAIAGSLRRLFAERQSAAAQLEER